MLTITNDTTLKELLEDKEALKIVAKYLGEGAVDSPMLGALKNEKLFSLMEMLPIPDIRKKLHMTIDEINGVVREEEKKDTFACRLNRAEDIKVIKVHNPNGPVLGYTKNSGMNIIEKDDLYFKDLAKDGVLHPYEDWRLPI